MPVPDCYAGFNWWSRAGISLLVQSMVLLAYDELSYYMLWSGHDLVS